MTRDDITAVALDVLGNIAPEADLDALDPHAPLQEQLELDSFDFLTFMQGLHDALGVEVPEQDYRRVATLSDCVDYLHARLPAPT